MGGGAGGGYVGRSLASNILRLSTKYPLDENGKFGTKGEGNAQVVTSRNPNRTAKEFFRKLSRGKDSLGPIKTGLGKRAVFRKTDFVVYRPDSKSGGPSINLRIKGTGLDYKIHFLKNR
jgi:hypothetical protein